MKIRSKLAFTAIALTLALPVPLASMPRHAFAQLPSVAPNGPPSLAPLVEQLLPSVVNISSTQKISAASMQSGNPGDEGQMDEGQEGPDGQDPDDQQGQGGAPQQMPQFPPGSPFEQFFNQFMNKQRQGGGMGQGPVVPATSLGSGFIIDAEKGYIVTNAHVVQDADQVHVTLHDDTTIPATVVGRDEKTDLALLKVDTKHKLVAAKFGDSGPMRVGDWVIAIGNPFGLGGTVTTGIISAQARDINAGPYDDFIQTDAPINRGNSGGPMFNMNGEVIGINTAIYSPSGGSVGIGFAIPSSLAKPVIDQIIKYGHTRRGWMGVRIQTVTPDIAESLGLDVHSGALVASVTPNSPAAKAGLKPGDVILDFDGKPVNQMRNLPRAVAETDINKTAAVTYWRDGKKAQTNVTIGELEKAEKDGLLNDNPGEHSPAVSEGTSLPSLGMSVRSVTDADRTPYAIPEGVTGVLVTNVAESGEALEKGMQQGDVIVEVNQQPVADAKALQDVIAGATKAGRNSVLLLVNHGGDVRFVALRLDHPSKLQKKGPASRKEANPAPAQ